MLREETMRAPPAASSLVRLRKTPLQNLRCWTYGETGHRRNSPHKTCGSAWLDKPRREDKQEGKVPLPRAGANQGRRHEKENVNSTLPRKASTNRHATVKGRPHIDASPQVNPNGCKCRVGREALQPSRRKA